MTREKVVVLDDAEGLLGRSAGIERIRARADVVVYRGGLADIPDADLRDVTALLAVRERSLLDAAALDRLPSLELILQTGGHAYHLDGDHAAARGITVALGRRARGPRAAMPEITFGLLIGAMRRFREVVPSMIEGGWDPSLGRTLRGKTMGILGYGRHGREVARIAAAFGMTVRAWNRTRSGRDEGVEFLPFDELLSLSDVVSVHLRLSEESTGLIGARELAAMKPGSVLINTSRGAIVDEAALVGALKEGPLSAAGLDVFADEPLAADSELRSLPNALLTPHIGWTVEEIFNEFADIAADQFEAFLAGGLDSSEVMSVALGEASG